MEYKRLAEHVGHKIVCVSYAEGENVAVECEDCNAVLVDANKEEEQDGV
jgi:hypothetical protein